jgi:hypothetical protein
MEYWRRTCAAEEEQPFRPVGATTCNNQTDNRCGIEAALESKYHYWILKSNFDACICYPEGVLVHVCWGEMIIGPSRWQVNRIQVLMALASNTVCSDLASLC